MGFHIPYFGRHSSPRTCRVGLPTQRLSPPPPCPAAGTGGCPAASRVKPHPTEDRNVFRPPVPWRTLPGGLAGRPPSGKLLSRMKALSRMRPYTTTAPATPRPCATTVTILPHIALALGPSLAVTSKSPARQTSTASCSKMASPAGRGICRWERVGGGFGWKS